MSKKQVEDKTQFSSVAALMHVAMAGSAFEIVRVFGDFNTTILLFCALFSFATLLISAVDVEPESRERCDVNCITVGIFCLRAAFVSGLLALVRVCVAP